MINFIIVVATILIVGGYFFYKRKKQSTTTTVESDPANQVQGTSDHKFEIYKDEKKEFRFRLKAGNGEVVAVSEGYKSKQACKNGIQSVKSGAMYAEITEV